MAVTQEVCAQLGLDLWYISSELIPTKPEEIEMFVQLWMRESALLATGLYVSIEDIESKLSS